MKFIPPLKQIVNNQTLEALKRSISKSIAEAAPHIQAVREKQVKILGQKFIDLNDWYMKMTGLDKVHLAQEKVTALQGELLDIQGKRRDVGRQLAEIRAKSIELQDEIHKVKRQDDLERFLDLMKKETEVLKLEKSISKTFQDYDQTERELFTAFSDSIRDSHEKQRTQMEYTKYFGLVLSITGSFLAFVYSTIRKNQLTKILDERLQTLGTSTFDHSPELISKAVKSAMESDRALLRKDTEVIVAKHVGQLKVQLANNINRGSGGSRYNHEIHLEESSEIKTFLEENSSYLKFFGVILGLCLISKVLS